MYILNYSLFPRSTSICVPTSPVVAQLERAELVVAVVGCPTQVTPGVEGGCGTASVVVAVEVRLVVFSGGIGIALCKAA
jgi:hypothetical protein